MVCEFYLSKAILRASLVAQTVKNLPAIWETQVPSLGWEDPLEKGMAIHSRILAWRIPWTEEPGAPQPMGLQSQTRLSDQHHHFHFRCCCSVTKSSTILTGPLIRKC